MNILEEKNRIKEMMDAYEQRILKGIALFEQKFGMRNPVHLWRHGKVERIGFLDLEQTIEYTFHGPGCNIEFPDGTIVSFDFDVDGSYGFDFFKFSVFLETFYKTREAYQEALELYKSGSFYIKSSIDGFILEQK